jgi:ribonuclease HI
MDNKIIIYTDGACSGNPGPGGWGVVMLCNGHSEEYCGGDMRTTNNRMELQAVIEALARCAKESSIILYTDSQYVHKGITEWLANWQRRGWKTANGKPVKNLDLWQMLVEAANNQQITWQWVLGHNGLWGNERADALARCAIEYIKRNNHAPNRT